jgi:pyruvate-ferredoxin/flavodoxin oxidoreductase
MCYPHVYVACVNIGYNKEQYLKALHEANNHNGPSIIIAYAPCIEHGIKTGMEHSLDDAKLATECGYFLTFRYNPDNETFTLDSKDVDDTKYDLFLSNENRYAKTNLHAFMPVSCNSFFACHEAWNGSAAEIQAWHQLYLSHLSF